MTESTIGVNIQAIRLLAAGRVAEAEAIHRNILASRPLDTCALSGLAAVVERRGAHDEALRLYAQAIVIDPADPLLTADLAASLDRRRRLSESLKHMLRAEALDPSEQSYAESAYDLLVHTGAFDKVMRRLQAACARVTPEIYLWLCEDLLVKSLTHGYLVRSWDLAAEYKRTADLIMASQLREGRRTAVLGPHWIYTRFGHMATACAAIVRLRQAGIFTDWNFVLHPQGDCCNPSYLAYWRRYFEVIPDPRELFARYGDRLHLLPVSWLPAYGAERYGDTGEAMLLAYGYLDEGRRKEPLLSLTAADLDRGRTLLEGLGVPRDAWFVCLHARSSAYLNSGGDAHNAHRNTDILLFEKAVRRIAEHGGYIVRIGTERTVPLPPWKNTIDLAHRMQWQDWMDVFVIGGCRFFLGDSSGPVMVAGTFGRPAVAVNLELGASPLGDRDIHMPKLFRDRRSGHLIPLPQAASSRLLFLQNGDLLNELDAEVIDNTAEDIDGATEEMLNALDGAVIYTEDDGLLQERFRRSFPKGFTTPLGRVSRQFLRKHVDLLAPSD